MPDPYAILGVKHGATAAEIRTAYRIKAKETHPDVNGGSTEAFQAVKAAHDALLASQRVPGGSGGFVVTADGRRIRPGDLAWMNSEIARAKKEIARQEAFLVQIEATVKLWAPTDPRPAAMRKPHQQRIDAMRDLIRILEGLK